MEELFHNLESNDPKLVNDAKQKLHDQLTIVKESWLLNDLYDYYLATNSVRSMEVLINIREPNYLFERLGESLKCSKNETKIQSLTLLGHVVRKQPTWLYKITNHSLFKDILKLLKQECDIVPLLSALLALIVLLPCIPSLMKPYLQDVFDIFSRLAAWNSNTPDKLQEEQMVHMQVSLCALFQRLYGMYPCNFLTYLREYYRNKERLPIFNHTIKPMLQRVQMHPLLVTTSKDHETAIDRWKKMSPHDVVVECESFSLDMKDRFSHETCFVQNTSFRSRSGTTNSTTLEMPLQFLKQSSNTPIPMMPEGEFFSPSMVLHSQTPSLAEPTMPTAIPTVHPQGAGESLVSGVAMQSQEGTSPPEAAIEATPETTPIKDVRALSSRQQQQQYMQGTTVARALNQFQVSRTRFACGSSANTTPTHSQPSSPMRKDSTTFNFNEQQRHPSAFGNPRHSNQRLQKLLQDRSQVTEEPTKTKPMMAPTSPLHIIQPSVISTENHFHLSLIESPISQEDEEVVSIVGHGEIKHHFLRQCDSVLYDTECRTNEEEIDDGEHGSPCTSGGLHLPNDKQMAVFRKNISRLRSCSQSDPNAEQSADAYILQNTFSMTVRRANSCPEMKKGIVGAAKEGINAKATLEENEEEGGVDGVHVNGFEQKEKCKKLMTSETQTENFWPMPYEHLFLSVFPSIDCAESKTTPAPSPAPFSHHYQEKYNLPTIYDIIDRYTDVATQTTEKDTVKNLKDQLQLLSYQLLFERHRRETHANRNRTLFIDVTDNRVKDEQNSALSDLVKLQESTIVSLKTKIDEFMKEKHTMKKDKQYLVNYWEKKFLDLQRDCNILKEKNDDLMKEVSVEKAKVQKLDVDLQNSKSLLFSAEAEVLVAKEQVAAADKCRVELENVNRELLLAGELILKYEERFAALDVLRRNEEEQNMLTEAYLHEIKGLQQQLESKITSIDAYRTRVGELEHNIIQHDETAAMQKKISNEVKEECHEKLKAVESKYKTQLAINRSLEEKIMELYQQIEMTGRRPVHSPDTSSCHEVNATMTDRTGTAPGLSPHSSPLSASLASSEGSMAFIHTDMKDMKNLQSYVDQKETTMMIRSSSTIESELNQEASYSATTSPGHSAVSSTSKTD